MARLHSAGPYRPSGLEYLVAEGLLDNDADKSTYQCHTQVFIDDQHQRGTEEVLRTKRCVIWSRNRIVKRVFNLDVEDESILHAFACGFSTVTVQDKATDAFDSRESALVVVLKTQVHIFCLSGPVHVVPLSFEVTRALAFAGGCVLQASPTSSRWKNPARSTVNAGTALISSSQASFLLTNTINNTNANSRAQKRTPTYCITDLLSELGLVAAHTTRRAIDIDECPLLSPDEEILHMSVDGELPEDLKNTCLAVSLNRTTSTITIWSVTTVANYASAEVARDKSTNYRRRQSSNIHERTRIPSGRGPAEPSRKSFGGLMQSFVETESKPQQSQLSNIETLAAELGQDFEPAGVQTRSARRISSMLARTDLAPPTERSMYNENTLTSRKSLSRAARNEGSIGSFTERHSFGGRKSFNASTTIYSNATSFLDSANRVSLGDSALHYEGVESPFNLLDDRLEKGLLMNKIKNFQCDDQSQAAPGDGFRVMIIPHPVAITAQGTPRHQLSVCVHERAPQVMTVITIAVKHQNSTRAGISQPGLKAIQVQKGIGIADACLVTEEHISRLVVLTKTSQGDAILHLEAPWSSSCRLDLPQTYMPRRQWTSPVANTTSVDSLLSAQRHVAASQIKLSHIVNSTSMSHILVADETGQEHDLRIELLPRDSLANRVLEICRYILPGHLQESMLVAYWEVKRWLSAQSETANVDFVALSITLFTLAIPFINALQKTPMTPSKRKKSTILRASNGLVGDSHAYSAMATDESGRAASRWTTSAAWIWLESTISTSHRGEALRPTNGHWLKTKSNQYASMLSRCVDLAREFLQSPAGENMSGPDGFLPTAMNQDRDTRRTALASVVVALHLLLEETKLEGLAQHDSDNSQVLISMLVGQMATWLGWTAWQDAMKKYLDLLTSCDEEMYFDRSSIDTLEVPPEPFELISIFEFIDSSMQLQSTAYHTLSELVTQNALLPTDPLVLEADRLLPQTSAVVRMLSGSMSNTSSSDLSMSLDLLSDTIARICQQAPAAQISRSLKSLQLSPTIGDHGITQALQQHHSTSMLSSHAALRDIRIMCNQSLDAESLGRWDTSSEIDRQALTKMVFDQDRRFQEASRLVNQARAPEIEYEPQSNWTEADALEAQKLLTQYATRRTFAVVAGRGMMHFNARIPLLTEMVPRAQFSMQCIIRARSNGEESQSMTFNADRTLFTEDKVCWAFFHNGASAGLMISKEAHFIDTSWIVYNKPSELTNRHAGFLLALGLNGNLKNLAKWVAFKYLTPKHTMTSVGLLLGLAASYIGTADTLVTRLMSVHVTCLLPPGAAELNLSPLTQTTGIMGIGLLYHNSQHRRMSEVLLSEIESREPEEPASEDAILRGESYRLAAGMSLGLINLGYGLRLHSLHDMRVAERLLAIAVGTKNVNIVQILDRATAGAVIAIAFIYLKTNDSSVARKVDIPDTLHQYDYVRPDIFLLRTLARHLIMWDEVQPTLEFVRKSIPLQYQHRADLKTVKRLITNDLPFFHVVAGMCFAIALRYAGSQRHQARDLLILFLDQFMRISRLSAINYDAKVTLNGIRNCLDILALSCAIVMAGSGDLTVYRRLRALHGRTDKDTPFGSHLAAHMAIGALFLSGGTATLGTSDLAVAAMVIAFYPLFPTDVLDNTSHLQALRHLWVLAVEYRCLVLRDSETGQVLDNIHAKVILKDGQTSSIKAPGLLPDLDTITTIDIVTDAYWPVHLELDQRAPDGQRKGDPRTPKIPKLALRDIYKASTAGINIHLKPRALYDNPSSDAFTAELSALNQKHNIHTHIPSTTSSSQPPTASTTQLNPNKSTTLSWIFNLPAFSHLDHAERALVLGGNGNSEDFLKTTPIDTALELDMGTLGPEGMQKRVDVDKLWQIRLVLGYADRMERMHGEGQVETDNGKTWLRKEIIERLRARVWEMSGAGEDGRSDGDSQDDGLIE